VVIILEMGRETSLQLVADAIEIILERSHDVVVIRKIN
jgi:hypothetical protein